MVFGAVVVFVTVAEEIHRQTKVSSVAIYCARVTTIHEMGITGGLDALLRVNVVREHMYTICERSVRSAANDILHGAPTIGSTDKFAIYADVASDIHCFALKVFGKIYKYGLACQLATLQKFIIRRVVDVTLAVVSMRASVRGTTTSDEAASLAHITFIIDGAAPAMKHPVRSVRRRIA